jgi:hypothetical protein
MAAAAWAAWVIWITDAKWAGIKLPAFFSVWKK